MALHHAVLALLVDGPRHGYDLKARFEETMGPQWGGLNIGHVYQVLGRLVRDGYAVANAEQLRSRGPARKYLQWIKASIGPNLRLIPVDQVAFMRSDEKYTLVAWSGGEALIRKTIRELADELDPEVFVQIHRSSIVNLHHVAQVVRGANETADVHLKGRPEVLPVSRSFVHLFRQM